MLILAGVSINLVIGNNGIITKAGDARDANKYATIKDEYELYKSNQYIESATGGSGGKTFPEFLADLKGRSICAQIGTSGAMFAQKIEGANVTQFNTASEAFMELNKGSCDATVNDKPVLEYYLATSKNDKLFMINDKFTQEQYGIVTSKNNKELSDKIEDGLKKIKANGTYDKIYEKWFGKREETK